MTCSWSRNFEQSHWVRISAIAVNSPERTKMLVSDPTPRRIPKVVGTKPWHLHESTFDEMHQIAQIARVIAFNAIEFRSLIHSLKVQYRR